MRTLYLAADGDDVGRKIEFFIVMNQMDLLSDFINGFQSAMVWLTDKLSKEFDAEIIFNGGDSLLASIKVSEVVISELENLRAEFSNLSHATISLGLGDSPRQAYFALKLAKASGKDRIESFQECIK